MLITVKKGDRPYTIFSLPAQAKAPKKAHDIPRRTGPINIRPNPLK